MDAHLPIRLAWVRALIVRSREGSAERSSYVPSVQSCTLAFKFPFTSSTSERSATLVQALQVARETPDEEVWEVIENMNTLNPKSTRVVHSTPEVKGILPSALEVSGSTVKNQRGLR